MKIIKPKATQSNRLSSHPSQIGRSMEMYKRPQAYQQPFERREMYKTQHLYDEEQSHRQAVPPPTDSNEDSEEFISFLNGYIKQLKYDPQLKSSKLEYVKDKVQQQRKFNRRMMKMVIAMHNSLQEREEELRKLTDMMDQLTDKENSCFNETKNSRPRRNTTDKFKVEDFLKGGTGTDQLNGTEDSVVDYRIDRTHTEAAHGRIGRRKSTIHSRQQSKLPLQDLERFISQSINVRKKK